MQMTRFWKKKKNLTLVQRKTYASATQGWEKKCVCVETLIKAFSISATSLAVVTTGAELAVITALRQSRVNRTGQCYQESVAAADMWWLTVMQLILTVCSPVMAALYFWNTESVFVLYVTTTENTKSPKSRLWTVLVSVVRALITSRIWMHYWCRASRLLETHWMQTFWQEISSPVGLACLQSTSVPWMNAFSKKTITKQQRMTDNYNCLIRVQ